MKLFDFFRKKALQEPGEQEQWSISEFPNEQIARNAALLELSGKLSGYMDDIVAEVNEALQQPEMYVDKWQDRLDERGITEPIEELAWIALVDALIEEQLAREIDWKTDGETIIYVIDNLLNRKKLLDYRINWSEYIEEERLTTYEILCTARSVLQEHDLALGCLDIESDCYVLITVPIQDMEALITLAGKAGYRIGEFIHE
ncbi:DUF6630 family protein [Paenibacillus sp. UNC451MF]|uniref:DUF6630 family protein n=1 Tax=Paenibacillus sp. UNC451MF TaxID=1449063 RepID=UPI000A76DCB3|nr:DUF6630 family protein [Paenibacillus sp. UNC451MF]